MPSPGVAVDVLTSAPSTATAETAAAAAQIAANLQAQYGLTASAEAPASSLAADALGGGGHQGIQQALSVSPPPPPPPPAGHPLPPPLSEDMPSWLSPRTEHIKNPLGMGADPRSSKSIRLNNIPHGISSSDVSAFCARTFGNVTKCSTSVDQTSSGVSAIVEFELQHSVQMAMRMQTVFLAGQRGTVVPVGSSVGNLPGMVGPPSSNIAERVKAAAKEVEKAILGTRVDDSAEVLEESRSRSGRTRQRRSRSRRSGSCERRGRG